MHAATTRLAFLTLAGLAAAASAQAQAPPAPVSLKAGDGTSLKATYFAAAKPGPGIVLLHQCNSDRSSWAKFAAAAAGRGYHVIAMDFRGFGESGGSQAQTPAEQQAMIGTTWPGDVDVALAYLTSQPGVDKQRIGVAGASCGVNQAAQLARRHREVRTVVMLSGGVAPEAREYLRQSPWLPIMAVASQDDGNAVENMRFTLGWSNHPASRFVEFKNGGHGTEMFAAQASLEPTVLEWFDRQLRNAPATVPTTGQVPPRTPMQEFSYMLAQPGGVAKARQIYDAARKKDRAAVLFVEAELNQVGYGFLQENRTKDAIAVFTMNVDAYPGSPNTYDSLSDAYLADGNRADALRYAELALEKLAADTTTPAEFKQQIRESAEKKVATLKKDAPAPR